MSVPSWLDQMTRGMVVAFSAVCSVAFVGYYTLGAVQALAAPPRADSTSVGPAAADLGDMHTDILWIIVAITVLLLVLATRNVPPSSLGFSRADQRPQRQGLLLLAMLGVLLCLTGSVAHQLVRTAGFQDPNDSLFDHTAWQNAIVTSFAAGIAEEILVLAVPFVLIERSGLTRWRLGRFPAGLLIVGTVLVAARMAYHSYRGWASLEFLPWAIAAVVAFYWTRALLAMITAHVIWDLTLLLLPTFPVYRTSTAAWYTTLGLLAALGISALAVLLRQHRFISGHLLADQDSVTTPPQAEADPGARRQP